MKWGVITFPGSNDDAQAAYVLEQLMDGGLLEHVRVAPSGAVIAAGAVVIRDVPAGACASQSIRARCVRLL